MEWGLHIYGTCTWRVWMHCVPVSWYTIPVQGHDSGTKWPRSWGCTDISRHTSDYKSRHIIFEVSYDITDGSLVIRRCHSAWMTKISRDRARSTNELSRDFVRPRCLFGIRTSDPYSAYRTGEITSSATTKFGSVLAGLRANALYNCMGLSL